MSKFEYALPMLVNSFQGFRNKLFFYPGLGHAEKQQGLLQNYPEVEVVTHDDLHTEKCYLGTPVYFPVSLKAGDYNVYKDGKVVKTSVSSFRLPLATLVSFERNKRSTETPTAGGTGSVTETYCIENWQIEIHGLCLDEPGHPDGAETFWLQQKRLLEFDDIVDAINVEGELFTVKNIYAIKINKTSFQPVPGKPRVLQYTIDCSSITPVELIYK